MRGLVAIDGRQPAFFPRAIQPATLWPMVLEKDPTRHPLDGFFDRLGETTLLDLFERYGIEERDRLGLLAATVAQVIDREDPTDDFVDRVLLVLEVNCRAYSDNLSFREQRAHSVERSPS